MNQISFKSGIKTVSEAEFNQIVQRVGRNNVSGYPWTLMQSVLGQSAYTKNFDDCSVLIITDGEKVFMSHLCPTNKENQNFIEIIKFVKNIICMMKREYMQAFVLGSKNNHESFEFFNNILNFLNILKIPTSYFRCGKNINHAAYSSVKDELIISNKMIKSGSDSLVNLKNEFQEIKLSEFDEII